jgi:hypothetical protein
VAVEAQEAPYFRCVLAPWTDEDDDAGAIGRGAAEHLGLAVGDRPWVLPLE